LSDLYECIFKVFHAIYYLWKSDYWKRTNITDLSKCWLIPKDCNKTLPVRIVLNGEV
jgi:hypothetical protein